MDSRKSARKAGMVFIFITLALDMISLGIVIPILPDVIRRFIQDPNHASRYFGYFISIYAIMQFLASPFLGMLSDVKGRRPVLLVSLFVAAIDHLIMGFAPTMTILFVGRVIASLTGANATVAMSYVADVSTDKNRAQNFGTMGAAFGLGFIIGPVIGGFLGHLGPQVPFIASAGLHFLNFLFGLFVLPESLAPADRSKMDWKEINPFRSLLRIQGSAGLLALLAVSFLFQLAGQTHPSIWALYTGYRFSWGPKEVGLSLAVVGICHAVVQGGLTRLIVPKIGETTAVLLGAAGYGISYFLYGACSQGWMMIAIVVFGSAFYVAQPALQSIITRQAGGRGKGELQGILVSLQSLSAVLNPIIVTQLFSYFTDSSHAVTLPGAPYFFASAMSFAGWVLLMMTRRKWQS
ncbi:MAG: TCR/Tet family MFS transporter [Bdellovibrionales bacterium]|nr:TCR/Tet family MFS transporter [Bdellovibrionales bacterium]